MSEPADVMTKVFGAGYTITAVTPESAPPPTRAQPAPRPAVIPQGALLTISTGEYNEYQVQGVFRALAPIDAEALRADWLARNPAQADSWAFEERAFIADVARKGLIELVDAFDWHVGETRDWVSAPGPVVDREVEP